MKIWLEMKEGNVSSVVDTPYTNQLKEPSSINELELIKNKKGSFSLDIKNDSVEFLFDEVQTLNIEGKDVSFNLIGIIGISNQKENPIVNEPKLVGYTNRVLGFNGCENAPIGTPVYEINGFYQISFKMLKNQKDYTVNWHKENLEKDIDFIKD